MRSCWVSTPTPATRAGTCSVDGCAASPATRSSTGCGRGSPSGTPTTASGPRSRCSRWRSPTSTCTWWPRVSSPTYGSSEGQRMTDPSSIERHTYDVVIVGAGGAGLRAAIAARDAGAHVAIVCKSLLGKAHTVMAEGGAAAAMGNLYPEDNWKVHFRDTMRGGKMLNHWRMAQLHAQESPARIHELEEWGALFDRTPDGLISQRDFGGHRYARLAHVGDRTGLE